MARPSLAEVAEAVALVRKDAVSALARPPGSQAPAATRGEGRLRRALASFGEELRQSPGAAWLGLLEEDFKRAVSLRRRIGQLEGELETASRGVLGRGRCAHDAHPRGDRGARLAGTDRSGGGRAPRRGRGAADDHGRDLQVDPARAAGARDHRLGHHLAGAPPDRGRATPGGRRPVDARARRRCERGR